MRNKRKAQHEERNMKEADDDDDDVVEIKCNSNDAEDDDDRAIPKKKLRTRNVATTAPKESSTSSLSVPSTSLPTTASALQKQLKKSNVEDGGLDLLASVSNVQVPVSTLVKNEKSKGLKDKNVTMKKDSNSDSTFKPEILEGSVCSLDVSNNSTPAPKKQPSSKTLLITLEETPSILKRHDTKSSTINIQTPKLDSTLVSHSRKRKQTLDIRNEEQFAPPILKPIEEKREEKRKKRKKRKVAKKEQLKPKIIIKETTTETKNDTVEFSVTHDHDYPIIPHNDNSENERNKENVQVDVQISDIPINTSNSDYDNSHYCLKDKDSIKVKCEKCSATFFSLRNFLIHLKKFQSKEGTHGQKQKEPQQQEKIGEIELKHNIDSSQNEFIESNPYNPNTNAPAPNVTDDEDESPFAELLSRNDDDDDDDVEIESGSDSDASVLDTDHSPSKFTNVRKVRFGNKLYKWRTPRNIQVEMIPVTPNLSPETPTTWECSCGQTYKAYATLALHCQKSGCGIPPQYRNKYICGICTAPATKPESKSTVDEQEHEEEDGGGIDRQEEHEDKGGGEEQERKRDKEIEGEEQDPLDIAHTTTTETTTTPITINAFASIPQLILPIVVGFKTKADLTKHMKEEHLGEKTLKCAYCSATFWYQSELQHHYLVHHKIFQKFECQICLNEGKSSSFTLLSQLHRHGRMCHTTKSKKKKVVRKKFTPMACPICFPSETSNEIEETEGKEETIHYQEIESNPMDSNSINLSSDFERNLEQEQLLEQKVEQKIAEIIIEGSPFDNTLNPPEKIMYTTKLQLIEHMMQAHPKGPKLLKCTYPDCRRDFYHVNSLNNHIKLTHRPKSDLPHQCKFEGCNKTFAYPALLMEHTKNHTGEKPFICEVCSRRFKSRHAIRAHVRTHVNEFPCSYCSKKFNVQHNLKRHIDAVHLGRKDFKCSFCELCFHQKVSLQAHEALKHTKERNHACSFLGCEQRFFSGSDLSRHRRIDHCMPSMYSRRKVQNEDGEAKDRFKRTWKKKQIQCSECGVISHGSSTHMIHMYNAHGIGSKENLCFLCGKTFLSLYLLNVHLRRTHNEDQKRKIKERQRLMGKIRKPRNKKRPREPRTEPMIYKCISCPNKTFSSASGLTRHLKIHNRDSVLSCPHPGCKWTFTSDYRLDRHCVTHHQDESKHLGQRRRRRMNESEQQQRERDEEAVRMLQNDEGSIVVYVDNDNANNDDDDSGEEIDEDDDDDQF